MLHIIFMIFYGDILSYFLYRKSFLTMRIKVVPFLGMFVGSCYGGKGFFQRNLWSDSILELCDAFELGSLGSGIWTNPIQTLLVVTGTWLDYDFPFSWECHHPNWRTPSFFRGAGVPPTRDCWPSYSTTSLFWAATLGWGLMGSATTLSAGWCPLHNSGDPRNTVSSNNTILQYLTIL
jgi:hypothetical protein